MSFPVCGGCSKMVQQGPAPVDQRGTVYHPQCFVCRDCLSPLAGRQFYQSKDRRLYCLNCYQPPAPDWPCAGCGKACSSGESVRWGGQLYHRACLRCSYCQGGLYRQSKITDGTDGMDSLAPAVPITWDHAREGEPCCASCEQVERLYDCVDCKQPIARGQQTAMDGEGPLCVGCAAERRGLRCARCSQIISQASWITDAQGRRYHDQCFSCEQCGHSLKGGKYYDQEPVGLLCPTCFGRGFCRTCPGCEQPVLENGVDWLELSFHQACFACCICHKPVDEYGRSVMFQGGNGLPTCRYCVDRNPARPIVEQRPSPPSHRPAAIEEVGEDITPAVLEGFVQQLLTQSPAPAQAAGPGDPLEHLLGELGLLKHLGTLQREEITAAELPFLSKEDLRQIGLPMGPASCIVRHFAAARPAWGTEPQGGAGSRELGPSRRLPDESVSRSARPARPAPTERVPCAKPPGSTTQVDAPSHASKQAAVGRDGRPRAVAWEI